jgi:transposase-like protein
MSYSPDLGTAICALLAEGKSLRAICRMFGLAESTVRSWALDYPDFGTQSRRARELGCDALAEEAIEIADTMLEGVETTTNPDGSTLEKRGDALGHRRLQIDTRLRLIGKWSQRYGERVAVTGEGGGPIKHSVAAALSDEDLARIANGGKA